MPKYKVGDVAALFPPPKEATTESGKRLQSLFSEFHMKKNKFSENQNETQMKMKKKKQRESFQGSEKEEIAEQSFKTTKNKKRTFLENVAANVENFIKKAKVDFDEPKQTEVPKVKKERKNKLEIDFPRRKKKDRKFDSNFSESIANDSITPKSIKFNISSELNSSPQFGGFIKKAKKQNYDDSNAKSEDLKNNITKNESPSKHQTFSDSSSFEFKGKNKKHKKNFSVSGNQNYEISNDNLVSKAKKEKQFDRFKTGFKDSKNNVTKYYDSPPKHQKFNDSSFEVKKDKQDLGFMPKKHKKFSETVNQNYGASNDNSLLKNKKGKPFMPIKTGFKDSRNNVTKYYDSPPKHEKLNNNSSFEMKEKKEDFGFSPKKQKKKFNVPENQSDEVPNENSSFRVNKEKQFMHFKAGFKGSRNNVTKYYDSPPKYKKFNNNSTLEVKGGKQKHKKYEKKLNVTENINLEDSSDNSSLKAKKEKKAKRPKHKKAKNVRNSWQETSKAVHTVSETATGSENVNQPDFIKVPGMNKEENEAAVMSRTLFIGNLPTNTTRKALRKLFSLHGPVENVRYFPIETDRKKIFQSGGKLLSHLNYAATAVPAYITFQDRESAVSALSLCGSVFENHHITVDFALPAGTKKLYDESRSIFIGNLAFDVEDESIWNAFSDCGKIEGVRVVRDSRTGIGKGFGYVLFSTTQGKEKALALNEVEIGERKVRIKAVESKGNLKKLHTKPVSNIPYKKDSFKSRAINIKKANTNLSSRKTVKKIMKKNKMKHNRKKIALILLKSK